VLAGMGDARVAQLAREALHHAIDGAEERP
jgi:hypothetical protein